MRNIDELKNELRETVRNSEEYREYRRLEFIIMRNPDLKRQVDEFRKRNFEIQNSEDQIDFLEATEELNRQYADVRNQDTVNRFLQAEVCLCRLVQDLCFTITEAVDFNLDFLQ